jgi:purine-binding chemotaxis protein CheW
VRGVVNLRGSVLPVIDVAIGLGIPEARATAQRCLLVVEAAMGGERAVVGLLADAVDHVLELLPDQIEPPPPFGTAVPAALLLGVARLATGFVLLLDLDRLLAEGLFRDERRAAEAPPRLPGAATPS